MLNIDKALAVLIFPLMMILTPAGSQAAVRFFEVGTFRGEQGVEIKVENSQYGGVQSIVLNGLPAGLEFYFHVYYNAYTNEFYNALGPSSPFQVRDISKGSKEVANFQPSQKYRKSEREQSGFRIIELYLGTVFGSMQRRALLIAEDKSGFIRSMKFEKLDDWSTPKFLRPFKRRITESGRVSNATSCEQLFH
jgi:hypothetical protein